MKKIGIAKAGGIFLILFLAVGFIVGTIEKKAVEEQLHTGTPLGDAIMRTCLKAEEAVRAQKPEIDRPSHCAQVVLPCLKSAGPNDDPRLCVQGYPWASQY